MIGDRATWAMALLACVLSARPSSGQSADDAAAQVREARLAQNAALASGMLDSAATFWATDLVVVASRGTVYRGRDTMRRAFAGDSVMVYVRSPARVEAASRWDLVWEEGTWSGHAGAGGPRLIGGRYAAQWHRVAGRWLIRSEVFVALTCTGDPCGWPLDTPPEPARGGGAASGS